MVWNRIYCTIIFSISHRSSTIQHPKAQSGHPHERVRAMAICSTTKTIAQVCRGVARCVFSPHHCVGFLFFALHPPLLPPARLRPPPPRLSLSHHPHTHNHSSHSTHHTAHSSHSSHTHSTLNSSHSTHLTPHSSHTHGTLISLISYLCHTAPGAGGFQVAGAVHRAFWRSGWLSCGRRSTQRLLEELLRAWPPLGRGWLSCGRRSTQSACVAAAGPRLAFVWQAQYTGPSGGTAAHVAAAGRGWISCGRRSTQILLEELLRACRHWAAAVWQAQYTEPSGGAAVRVAAAGFRVAGAVHRAFYGGGAARMAAAGPRLAFVWQTGFRVAGVVHRACARGRRWAAAG